MATRSTTLEKTTPAALAANKLSFRRWLREVGWRHAVLIVGVLFALFPLAWIVSASFNVDQTITGARLIPERVTFDSYKDWWSHPNLTFPRWLLNSLFISFTAAAGSLALSTFAAYSFARLRWRGRRTSLLGILLVQMFPQFLGFVAIFILLQRVGEFVPAIGLNTYLGLVFVYLGGAIGFNTWLTKGFMDSIPVSLDEAALVDGATGWDVFSKIIVPLTRPILVVIFLLSFINLYSEYILASIIMRSDTSNFTYAIGLNLLVQSTATFDVQWGLFAAAAVLGALPIVLLWLVLQNQIVSGLTAGSVKG